MSDIGKFIFQKGTTFMQLSSGPKLRLKFAAKFACVKLMVKTNHTSRNR